MSSGHDVSEYELGASGLPPMLHHNNRGKIDENPRKTMIFVKKKTLGMVPPEDRVISLFAGLLANHDRAHSQGVKEGRTARLTEKMKILYCIIPNTHMKIFFKRCVCDTHLFRISSSLSLSLS